MKKYRVGYTQGVFDMFHIGHLNLLRQAKEKCDILIVGVNTDTLVEGYKHKLPVINEIDRLEIIKSIKYVDEAFLVETLDKTVVLESHPFEVVFIGDDWKGHPRWKKTEKNLKRLGRIVVEYLPHTPKVSSTELHDYYQSRIYDGNH